ncbi:GvpL/GvpF family gas vesicle protein [Actinomadura rudentiformis]|uniref:GvpL/GvpF family gas vesicle protein n=1 Tax=Actinomadura rudentiformis TaxID=359158 RepID=A0A6H9YNH6_9ACTN|nr:GvpL/GvpF family gas vesicle protein [Actinomadura rudentiformis]KAB2349021.1 GvpL/GvpF family gas vesicle protein [Actinomadura rudentiformis]
MTEPAGTAVYLYGVSRGLDPAALPDTPGVGGAPVRAVTAGDLTALVSTVREADYGEEALRVNLEDLSFLEATARAHHDVVDQAARTAPTAPVRIATLYRDDDRVARLLTEQHDTFTRALDRITGRSEWGVKAYAYAEAMAAAPAGAGEDTTAPAGGSGAGAAYLRNRQAQRRQREDAGRRITAQAQAIHAELADHAVATRQHPPQDPKLSGHDGTQILNVAYLLDDDQVEGFLAAVKDVDARLPGIGAEVTGPWPPYSFIDTGDTEAGERR